MYEDIKEKVQMQYEYLQNGPKTFENIAAALAVCYCEFLNLAKYVEANPTIGTEFKEQIACGVYGYGSDTAYPGQLNMIIGMIKECVKNGGSWQLTHIDYASQAHLTTI